MKINKYVISLLNAICFCLFFSMIVIVFCQVVFRYALSLPLAWSDELSRLLLVWVSFLGVTLVFFSEEGHPAITFLIDKLPLKTRNTMSWLMNLMFLFCFIVAGISGLKYAMKTHRFLSPVLQYPTSLKYAVVPISLFLMSYRAFDLLISPFMDKNNKEEKIC